MYNLSEQVDNFIFSLEKSGYETMKYLPNQNWKPGDPIYYSGPYWDNREVTAAITTLLGGQWLPAGENVNKFERAFSKKFDFCLLYTSPSPRDATLSRMPSSA